MEVRRRGIPISVVLSGSAVSGAAIYGAGSCVLDTESRSLSGEEAFQKIVSETEKIPFENFHRVIKKVDSTLRGNIGDETRALDSRYGSELIVFAPALPDLGRTTVNRIHLLRVAEGRDGVPISQTELARDPKTPVKNDNIVKLMAEAFPGEKVVHIGLDAIRRCYPPASGGALSFDEARIFCFDAASNADLQTIVRSVLATGKRVLWVGSSGLANSLLSVERPVPPALAVIASLSSVTRSQVHYAEKQGVSLAKAPLYAILEKKTSPEDIANDAAAVIKEGRDAILLSSSTYSAEEYEKTEESARLAGLSAEDMSAYTQKTMGLIAALVLEQVKVSGLFLSGGDTAMSCFESLGAKGSSIDSEAALGIPLMRLLGGKYESLKVVTKAGAFGKEDAVFFALRKLREN